MKRLQVITFGLLLALSVFVQTTTAQFLPTDARCSQQLARPLPIRRRTNQRPFLSLNRLARSG